MHPNSAFRGTTPENNIRFARERGFGVLAVAVDGLPLLSHVPFLLSEGGSTADLHLVRSNPISRMLRDPVVARIAVSGPDGYISPDWYEVADQVPTWNYVAVHLTGELVPLPDSDLRGILDRETAFFETRLLPKTPWHADKMTEEALGRMMRMIVPCRFHVHKIDGTWKLNQNKPEEVRLRAADRVAAVGFGLDTPALSQMMRDAAE
ncbi:FMN-binding negative transcriptional regulator [Ruegeria hyattellae]|uniref:FMN-binding negative transcriptional regulator n=1 Tax=Ruegeria hyattellae TaxID=3233337 RepID=UPI00355BA3E4